MPNQELIYQIASAVYEEFGEDIDDEKAENFVTKVYRAVEPFLMQGENAAENLSSENPPQRIPKRRPFQHYKKSA